MNETMTNILEEGNIPRLGLISVHPRLPDDVKTAEWTEHTVVGGLPGTITCKPDKIYGVPHGIDCDVSSAIHTAYMIRNMPESGTIDIGAAELLGLMGVSNPGGVYYTMLRESLERLAGTRYEITAHWFTAAERKMGKASFTYLSYREIQGENLFFPGRTSLQLRITLNDFIRDNLRDGYHLTFAPGMMKPLKNPTARALARMLESFRRDPHDISRAQSELTMSVQELRSAARILGSDQRASRTLRLLQPALDILEKNNQIKRTVITGRGDNTLVTVYFTDNGEVFDTESYAYLVDAKVWPSQAKYLASSLPRDQIVAQVDEARERHGRGEIIDLGAYIWKALHRGSGVQALERRKAGHTPQKDHKPVYAGVPAAPHGVLNAPAPVKVEVIDPVTNDQQRNELLLRAQCDAAGTDPETRDLLLGAARSGGVTALDVTDLITRRTDLKRLAETVKKRQQG